MSFFCIAKVVYLRAQMELAGPPQHKSQWHLACRQIAIVFIASRPLWMLPSTFMFFTPIQALISPGLHWLSSQTLGSIQKAKVISYWFDVGHLLRPDRWISHILFLFLAPAWILVCLVFHADTYRLETRATTRSPIPLAKTICELLHP